MVTTFAQSGNAEALIAAWVREQPEPQHAPQVPSPQVYNILLSERKDI